MLGARLDQDRIVEIIREARVVRFKPIGTSSIVYEMLLDGEVHGAFKPRTVQHPRGHLAEIAAYRLARLLGLDNVPPAVTRRVSAESLHARLHPDFDDSWPDIVEGTLWDDDGRVTGAAIYWVPNMRGLGVERRGRMRRWSRQLSQRGAVPDDARPLHADLSTTVALDYLIGNWDRWSGSNAQGLPDGSRLFVRDHNVAFAAPLNEQVHERVLRSLLRTEKFSRSFVRNLLRMTEPRLRAELALDPGSAREPLLVNAQIRAVMERRRTLISYVASLTDMYGEDRVLVFP